MEAKALLAMWPRDSTALACQYWVQTRLVLHPLPLSSESLAEASWISFPLCFPSLDSCLRMRGWAPQLAGVLLLQTRYEAWTLQPTTRED